MKIDYCLVACDLNQNYMDFYPLVRHFWKKMLNIDCILILISTYIPECLEIYKDEIILFEPIKHINTAFQAQCIRILYPSLLPIDKNIIISDMDIIPLNQSYFEDTIKYIDNHDIFVIYRDVISVYNQYPICYCLASSQVWKSIFNIQTIDCIRKRLNDWYLPDYQISSPSSTAWAQDQLQLFQYVNNYKGNIIKFTDEDTKFNRLDRSQINFITQNYTIIKENIKIGQYSDFHLPRPYKNYSNLLDVLLNDD